MGLDFTGTAGAVQITLTLNNAAGGQATLTVGSDAPVTFDVAKPFTTPVLAAGSSTIVAVSLTATSATGGTTDLTVTLDTIGGQPPHAYSTNAPACNPFTLPGLSTTAVPSTVFAFGLHMV